MSYSHISTKKLRSALALRDLSDPEKGAHAMQLLLGQVEDLLSRKWEIHVRQCRSHPVVSVTENYDRLLVSSSAVARDARYTRYIDDETVLRTHTSAMIPTAIQQVAGEGIEEVLLSCPGLVYRRDSIDRQHTGEPHQVDLWRIRKTGSALDVADLEQMIAGVVEAATPGRRWRTLPAEHSYTTNGLQIDVEDAGGWIEVGECGLAHRKVLARCGLDVSCASGLAMGLGLDRLLMLRKSIDDIRLLRSEDPRVTSQMTGLEKYTPVSSMPPVKRDLSIAISSETTAEELGDRVREGLGDDSVAVESIEVLGETDYETLAAAARERLGIRPGQKNVLIRVVLRDLRRTLTDSDANLLRDRIYGAVHEGTEHVWASNVETS